MQSAVGTGKNETGSKFGGLNWELELDFMEDGREVFEISLARSWEAAARASRLSSACGPLPFLAPRFLRFGVAGAEESWSSSSL